MKALKISLFSVFFIFIASFSFAAEKVDTFSITTYYPVPYVSYKKITTNTISSQETEIQNEFIKEDSGGTIIRADRDSFPGPMGGNINFQSDGTLDTIVLDAFDSEFLAEKIEGLLELHQGEGGNTRVFDVWPGLGECRLFGMFYILGFYDANCGPNAALAYIRENPFGIYVGAGIGVGGGWGGLGTGAGVKIIGTGQFICCDINQAGSGGPPPTPPACLALSQDYEQAAIDFQNANAAYVNRIIDNNPSSAQCCTCWRLLGPQPTVIAWADLDGNPIEWKYRTQTQCDQLIIPCTDPLSSCVTKANDLNALKADLDNKMAILEQIQQELQECIDAQI